MKYLICIISLLFFAMVHSQEAKNIKVLSYNIWNGFDFGKDTSRIKKFQQWMKKTDVDIAAFQELCAYDNKRLKAESEQWGHPYSLLMKTSGYSVGVSSKYPIELKEKISSNLHHGALHCKINGIDFLIVHLHPGSILKRKSEMQLLSAKIDEILKNTDKLIVLGDFNSHSPFDQYLYDPDGELIQKMKKGGNMDLDGNMDNGNLDYSVISGFLAKNLYDVLLPFSKDMAQRSSFPTPALIPSYYKSEEEVDSRGQRIDYILASRALSAKCMDARILNGEANDLLSDHYPVLAIFQGL